MKSFVFINKQLSCWIKKASTAFIAIGLMSLFLISCGGAKNIVGTSTTPKMNKAEEYLAQQVFYKSFAGKAKMEITSNGENKEFTSNIKMTKDKDIWASIIAMGGIIEAARAYITPEKLKVLNKLEATYYDLNYEEGMALIDAQVPFADLQNILIGNRLMQHGEIVQEKETDSTLIIVLKENDVTETLEYRKSNGTLKQLFLESVKQNFQCTIDYDAYGPTTGKQPFAYNRNIKIYSNNKQTLIKMNFIKADLDMPFEVNFNIPSSYTKVRPKP